MGKISFEVQFVLLLQKHFKRLAEHRAWLKISDQQQGLWREHDRRIGTPTWRCYRYILAIFAHESRYFIVLHHVFGNPSNYFVSD